MKNLEGKQIVHDLHGRDGRVQFQPGGGPQNLHGRCKFVGGWGGPLTSWAWKWYFQHIQRDISLQKLNLDKVLKKNIFLLEKLPFPHQPPRLCCPCMGMDNREWHILRGTQRLFSVKYLFGGAYIA